MDHFMKEHKYRGQWKTKIGGEYVKKMTTNKILIRSTLFNKD